MVIQKFKLFLLKYSNIKNFIYLLSFPVLGKNSLKKPKKGDGFNGY